jgi:hypothetical protein
MRKKRYRLQLIFLLVICLGSANICKAQNTSFEFWPETDIWCTLNPSWRLSALIPVTKYCESKDRDLNVYLQAEYKWGSTKLFVFSRLVSENRVQQVKAYLVRGGFMEGWSLGENSSGYTEDMAYAEIHKRIPLKGRLLFSLRLRPDFRWVGEEPEFSYRIRYRVMLEKDFTVGRSSIVPYVNVEPYWDSRYSTVSRVRAIAGGTVIWGSRLAYEANLTYQYDSHYNTPNVYAINGILHVFF